MLKEFYILKETNLYFYFSSQKTPYNLDDVILSTGLLSALSSFTQTSRSEKIDLFQTEKEIFKFKSINEAHFIFVFVFDSSEFNKEFSDIIMQNVYELITNSQFLSSEKTLINLEDPEYKKLTEAINYILDYRLPKQLTDEILKQILEQEQNIDYCIIKEIPSGITIAKYSKRLSFSSSQFEDDVLLVISVINKVLNNLNLASKFLIITFESEDQKFLIFNMGEYSVAILSVAQEMQYYIEILKYFMFAENLFKFARFKIADFMITSSYTSDQTGKIQFKGGVGIPKANIFLGTLIHNIRKFSSKVLSKGLFAFSIVYLSKKKELSMLNAVLKGSSFDITVNID